MDKVLHKKALPKWLKELESYEIYAPQENDDLWSFELVKSFEFLDSNYSNCIQSPKKIIFPQTETLLKFERLENGKLEVEEQLPEDRKKVIFGVRPCDAKALTLMDKVFTGDFEDLYYTKRRNQTTLVGLGCNTPPSPQCFCVSVGGSPHSNEGLDILMTDLEDKYYLQSFTAKGNELLILGKNIFEEPNPDEKSMLKRIHQEAKNKFKTKLREIEKIPDKLKGMFDSSFWDEEAMSCIRCGICTYLCPTCHCFDINDEVYSTSSLRGKRIRTWDTCQFPDFTMHSSGHNPRPDKASRLRQRIFHKFQYFVEKFNAYQCTGCGRCISKCPVGIDITEILEKVKNYGS